METRSDNGALSSLTAGQMNSIGRRLNDELIRRAIPVTVALHQREGSADSEIAGVSDSFVTVPAMHRWVRVVVKGLGYEREQAEDHVRIRGGIAVSFDCEDFDGRVQRTSAFVMEFRGVVGDEGYRESGGDVVYSRHTRFVVS